MSLAFSITQRRNIERQLLQYFLTDQVYFVVNFLGCQYKKIFTQRSWPNTGFREYTDPYWSSSTERIRENIHLVEVIENVCIVTQARIYIYMVKYSLSHCHNTV